MGSKGLSSAASSAEALHAKATKSMLFIAGEVKEQHMHLLSLECLVAMIC